MTYTPLEPRNRAGPCLILSPVQTLGRAPQLLDHHTRRFPASGPAHRVPSTTPTPPSSSSFLNTTHIPLPRTPNSAHLVPKVSSRVERDRRSKAARRASVGTRVKPRFADPSQVVHLVHKVALPKNNNPPRTSSRFVHLVHKVGPAILQTSKNVLTTAKSSHVHYLHYLQNLPAIPLCDGPEKFRCIDCINCINSATACFSAYYNTPLFCINSAGHDGGRRLHWEKGRTTSRRKNGARETGGHSVETSPMPFSERLRWPFRFEPVLVARDLDSLATMEWPPKHGLTSVRNSPSFLPARNHPP
jgi:hypothetical protein